MSVHDLPRSAQTLLLAQDESVLCMGLSLSKKQPIIPLRLLPDFVCGPHRDKQRQILPLQAAETFQLTVGMSESCRSVNSLLISFCTW